MLIIGVKFTPLLVIFGCKYVEMSSDSVHNRKISLKLLQMVQNIIWKK